MSLVPPRAGAGRSASSIGASRQVRHSSAGVIGIAFGWSGPTTPFASAVANENGRCSSSTGSSRIGPHTPVQGYPVPAKAKSRRLSSSANLKAFSARFLFKKQNEISDYTNNLEIFACYNHYVKSKALIYDLR